MVTFYTCRFFTISAPLGDRSPFACSSQQLGTEVEHDLFYFCFLLSMHLNSESIFGQIWILPGSCLCKASKKKLVFMLTCLWWFSLWRPASYCLSFDWSNSTYYIFHWLPCHMKGFLVGKAGCQLNHGEKVSKTTWIHHVLSAMSFWLSLSQIVIHVGRLRWWDAQPVACPCTA